MNMASMRDIYAKATRKKRSPEESIECAIMHPTLVRRLVCLFEDKVKLADKCENPWYDNMIAAGIDPTVAENAKDFVNFCIAEEQKVAIRYKNMYT